MFIYGGIFRNKEQLKKKSNKLQIPLKLQKQLIREIHKHPLHGHPEIHKTLKKIKQTYQFFKIRIIVNKVLKRYDLYGKNKAKKHKPYGKLQPLPITKRP